MRTSHPPRLATLLLERFAANEPLIGDLQEEYAAGQSNAWYWRQALTAVAVAMLRGLNIHELFAPQNMPMQIVMLLLVSLCAVFTVKVTAWMLFHEEVRRTIADPAFAWDMLRLAVSFGLAVLIGSGIARIHEHHRQLAVAAFSTATACWSFVNITLLNGHGSLDPAWIQVMILLAFVSGLLSGGMRYARSPGAA